MEIAGRYFQKMSNHTAIFHNKPSENLGITIVIPCFDEPDILHTIESILNCTPPSCFVEIIVIINASSKAYEGVCEQNIQTHRELELFCKGFETEWVKILTYLNNNLPKKHAGAGLARKIGMDEALMRFNSLQRNGIIVSLDADTQVEKNYLLEIEKEMVNNDVGILAFEHLPTSDVELQVAINTHELYLRYVKSAFQFIGYPYSFHTIGSAFCVKAEVYARFGGMNKKHAGEDFYFLHKLFPNCSVTNIVSTRVFPSSRISRRVPFGTGPSLKKIINEQLHLTYSFKSLQYVRKFILAHSKIINAHEIITHFIEIKEFLESINYINEINRIQLNSTNEKTFTRNFFNWFNAFFIVKMLNFLGDNLFEKEPIQFAVQKLLSSVHVNSPTKNIDELLCVMREIDNS